MKWWKKALIGSLVWTALLVILVLYMDQHIKTAAESPAHAAAWDEKFSNAVGMLFAVGQLAIWALFWSRGRLK